MITIKSIEDVDWEQLTDYSKWELAITPKWMLDKLNLVQIVDDEGRLVVVGGLLRQSLLTPAHLILLLGKGFRARRALFNELHDYLMKLAPDCQTLVQASNVKAVKLAQAWGFRKTDFTLNSAHGTFDVYRRRTWRS